MVNKRTVLAVVVMGLLLSALSVWLWHGRSRRSAVTDGSATDAGASPIERLKRQRHSATPSPSPKCTVSGRVLGKHAAEPIGGATVLLTPAAEIAGIATVAANERRHAVDARTDAEGRFSIEGVTKGRYGVSATARGYLPSALHAVLLCDEESRLNLELEVGGVGVLGQVSDVTGGPVGGARVEALDSGSLKLGANDLAPYSTLSGPDGSYHLSLPVGSYALSAVHPSYVVESHMLKVDRDGQRRDFQLVPAGSIEGRVLRRSDRAPVPGALVHVDAEGGVAEGMRWFSRTINDFTGKHAETDAEGRFVLSPLRAGSVRLVATAVGYAPGEPTIVDLGVAERLASVDVLVDTGYSVSGFVVQRNEPDRGFPGAFVSARDAGTLIDLTWSRRATSDDGYFEVIGLAPGRYTLSASSDKLAIDWIGMPIEIVDRDVNDVVLVVDTGSTLTGRVEPALKATVKLSIRWGEAGAGSQMPSNAWSGVRTTDDGAFSLTGIGKGKYVLVGETADGRRGTLPIEVADGDQSGLVVRLSQLQAISGNVIDSRGKPVPNVTVTLSTHVESMMGGGGDSLSDFRYETTVSGGEGEFGFAGIGAGAYALRVTDDLGARAYASPANPERPRDGVVVRVAPHQDTTGVLLRVESSGASLQGRVLDESGEPAADAWITASLQDEGATDAWRAWEFFGKSTTRTAFSDADGRFSLQALRDGRYTLSARTTNPSAHARLVDVPIDSSPVLRLQGLASLVGTIRSGGKSVLAYSLALSGPMTRVQTVRTPSGGYRLMHLEAGKYKLAVDAAAGYAEGEIELIAGEERMLDLELVGWSGVRGQLVGGDGKPIAGATALAIAGDIRDASAWMKKAAAGPLTTDEQGRFRDERLRAGQVHVSFLRGFQPLLLKGSGDAGGFSVPEMARTFELAPGEQKDLGVLESVGDMSALMPK